MNRKQEELLKDMITYLSKEDINLEIKKETSLVETWRALVNLRKAEPVSNDYLALEDEYLKEVNTSRYNISDCLPTTNPKVYIFKGDITTLEVDAIVNAANSDMLGCFIPNHHCIDNAIHTYAGVRLRLACHEIIEKQGRKEAVGQAKITPAYNLPSKYVIHTVGPYIYKGKEVSLIRANLLRQSYLSCLRIAEEYNLNTVAICSISTGEFGFPKDQASSIAISTVEEWLNQNNSKLKVIFNVFSQEDFDLYTDKLLR